MKARAAVLAAAAVVLAGCAAPLPNPEPDAVPAATPPALAAEQVEEILADVAATLEEADEETSADALAPRVTGPARTIRTVEYTLADAGDDEAITPVPAGAQTVVVPTTTEWPRTVMVITPAPEDLRAPLLLTLVQSEPREPYRLWSWARLFPGVETPSTAQPEVGSRAVEPGSADLVMTPTEALERYVEVLGEGDDSEHAEAFLTDPLREGIAQTRAAFEDLVGENGSLTETYQAQDGPLALATADGGAIVVGTVQTVTTITLEDSTLTIGDETEALLGEDTVESNLEITWLSVVVFHVPPQGSDRPVEVLGAEHSRIEVTGE